MIDLASALTLPLAKLLLKSCLGDVPADIGDNLLKLGFQRFGDWAKARQAQQLAKQAAAGVVTNLEEFFAKERVDPNQLEVAALDLGTTVADHVDAALLVRQNLDTAAIETGVLQARALDAIDPKDDPARDTYVRLVKALAPRLREIAPQLPRYEVECDAEFFGKLAQIAAATPQILAEVRETARRVTDLADRPKQLAEGYEADYLKALCAELNRVEIIGLSVDEPACGGELEVAYLSLRTRLGILGETQSVDFATLLTLMPKLGNRILIEGPAGSGKSTLLRWAGIQAARFRLGEADTSDPLAIAPEIDSWLPRFLSDDERRARPSMADDVTLPHRADSAYDSLRDSLRAACWRGRLPFLIPLRRAKDGLNMGSLNALVIDLAGEPTDQWLNNRIKPALLLIDGVDEVPAGEERRATLKAIEQWSTRFSDAQIVVTSRPGAVVESALGGFTRVELDELNDDQKVQFVDHWHRALAAKLRWEKADPMAVELANGVERELAGQHTLNDLAANPLL